MDKQDQQCGPAIPVWTVERDRIDDNVSAGIHFSDFVHHQRHTRVWLAITKQVNTK